MAHKLFNGLKIGKVEKDYAADLIIVDYKPFTEMNKDNFPWHVVFGFQDGMITDTIVQGRFVMRDKKIIGIDESAIVSEARKVSKMVWKRYHAYFK